MVEQEIRLLPLFIKQVQGDQGTETIVDNIPNRAKRLLVEVFPEKGLSNGFRNAVPVIGFGSLVQFQVDYAVCFLVVKQKTKTIQCALDGYVVKKVSCGIRH